MDLSPTRVLVWFSCGAASAVAAALTVKKYGERCEVVTCDTRSTEHADNERFLRDVERWIGRSIRDLRSTDFASIDEVYEKTRYMAGLAGARCTVEMKKAPRIAFERDNDTHVFGFTFDEKRRAADFEKHNPTLDVEHILIEERVTKEDCYTLLTEARIRLPEMYALGFDHNNCLGCVKATSPDYWNLTRKHFPEVFARRATQSEALGVRLARVSRKLGETLPRSLPDRRKGKIVGYRVFLSDLPAEAVGGGQESIECGPVCQTPGRV
jgi:3'-phosphoadenosine 5'-phosphosulfate sulfotransferase (PAPS reductase)/FAD synthetase